MRSIIIEPNTPQDHCFISSIRSAYDEFCEVTNILDNDAHTLVSKFFPWLTENYGLLLKTDWIDYEAEINRLFISNEQKYFIFQIKFANND